jgi:GGDEF domain-containing protein
VRNADLVVRLGGDEFAFLLDGLDDAEQLRARALSAAASLMRPLRTGTAAAGPLGVHIGGAISPHHGSAAQALFAAAGQALAAAKQGAHVYRLAGEG